MASDLQPAISVCIPVYNGEAFIKEAVESVLAQDYSHFEVKVCENVSTDGTRVILEELEREHMDERLQVLYESEHVHLAANLNRAARLGQFDWILVLSADDFMLPNALQTLGENILRYPQAEVFIGQASYLVETKDRALGRADYHHEPGVVSSLERFVVGNSFPVNINATLLKGSIARFSEDCGVVCDLELMIRLGQEGKDAVLVQEELIGYREHDGATSANRLKMWEQSLAVYLRHAPSSELRELYRRRVFRMLFWCGQYLKGQGQSSKAVELIKSGQTLLGAFRANILYVTLKVPIRMSLLVFLRSIRRKFVKD